MKTKTNKANLERKKSLFFQAGLVVALSLVLLAFEWPSTGDIKFDLASGIALNFDEEMIPITRPEDVTPPPPPPVISTPDIINIVDDDVEIENEDEDIFKDIDDKTFKDLLKNPIVFEDEKDLDETIPFMLIEEQPTFMGGDHRNFTKWVFANLKYPEIAAQNGIQGRVTLEFTIDVDGSVTNVRVVRGIDSSLDAEALRVVSNSPKWSPGLQRGKPTKVSFTFPVTFRLN
ncbi:energy transducer TonB [Perlabentimonas gracilis]|uniref:energy transducer TonB n=1 Tax=Perlabentimonas gracilis TaxID=2715279 RepID=UPI001408AFD9|nr:energy transducer TonB [Perlabentimonas gracilis]NHB69823.1 energy transducer TonB [Perlabentimonas gracilis]